MGSWRSFRRRPRPKSRRRPTNHSQTAVNVAQTTKQKAGGRWPLPLFQSLLPIDRSGLAANLAAGISLAAMNIPQAMGYAKIAGMPVMTGLYTLLLPLVAFAALGSSRYLV